MSPIHYNIIGWIAVIAGWTLELATYTTTGRILAAVCFGFALGVFFCGLARKR